jgi:aryl-alcohol dehydrogenase-like predicted oxidoreductase
VTRSCRPRQDEDHGPQSVLQVNGALAAENGWWKASIASLPVVGWRTKLAPSCLTGTIRSPDDLADDDWRKNNPRFTEGNLETNLRIVDEVEVVASEVGATPAQVALAWLLPQGDDIAPIPGTKRVSRVEENTAADRIELSAEQIARLNDLTPATGERHNEANMSTIDR